MKRFCSFAIIVLFLYPLSCHSQKLEIVDFHEDIGRLDAVTNSVKDLNGTLCGLIRLGLVHQNVEFGGDVVKTDYRKGEWFIWMAEGARYLVITAPGYLPLHYDFNEPIKSKVTYIMTITKPIEKDVVYETIYLEKKKFQLPQLPSADFFKPDSPSMSFSINGGTNLAGDGTFTYSYFLVGWGLGKMILTHEQIATSTLINSGYSGEFTKTTSMNLDGNRAIGHIELGFFFNYFSISCQVGFIGLTVNRTIQYSGQGYGLVDGDLNENWGNYEQRTFINSTSDVGYQLTVTPIIRGYIPIGSLGYDGGGYGITFGLSYTFIPFLDYFAGFTLCLGMYIM